MASRVELNGSEDNSKKRKQVLDVPEGCEEDGENVSVKLDTGEMVVLKISQERVQAFRDLRQAQRVRFAKFFKQLTDDIQSGKELPLEHELYHYLAPSEKTRLRELASLLAKDKRPPPPPPARVPKPEFDQAVSILAAAHPCQVRNWPKDALYSSKLMSEYDVRNLAQSPQTWPAQPSLENFIEIKALPEHGHPAYPGWGVYATHPIPGGTEIGLYTGILRKRQKTNDSESLYIAALTRETDIDAEQVGNEVRFINDYRNTGKEPNVKYERAQRGPRLVLIVRTTRPIDQGEELLVDYGDEYWRQLHKNKRRRAVREANQYSDADTEESSEDTTPPRRPSTRSSDDTALMRQWHIILDEVQPRGNRAIDWLVKEELPEVLATGRRRFSVPVALLDEADVFARLNWPRFDKNSWKIPEELEIQTLVRTYDEHQKTHLRARAARAASLYASGGAQQRKKPAMPVGDEGAGMLTGYPELLGLLQLRELKENGIISQEEFAQYKSYLQRAFVGRFN